MMTSQNTTNSSTCTERKITRRSGSDVLWLLPPEVVKYQLVEEHSLVTLTMLYPVTTKHCPYIYSSKLHKQNTTSQPVAIALDYRAQQDCYSIRTTLAEITMRISSTYFTGWVGDSTPPPPPPISECLGKSPPLIFYKP